MHRVVDDGTWGFGQVQQMSYETQVKYTPRKNYRTFISKGVQNGSAFEIIACSAVDLLLMFNINFWP